MEGDDEPRPSVIRYERVKAIIETGRGRVRTMRRLALEARHLAKSELAAHIDDRISQIHDEIVDEITKVDQNVKDLRKEYRAKMSSTEIHVVVDPPRTEFHAEHLESAPPKSLRHSIHAAAAHAGPAGKVLAVMVALGTLAGALKALLDLLPVSH